MTIKPEVLAAIESLKNDAFSWIELADVCDKVQIDLQLIQSELLAMDAETSRLRGAISQHRDQFPDEALDGDIALWSVLDAHLSEPRP